VVARDATKTGVQFCLRAWRRADFGDTGRGVCACAAGAGAGLLVAGLPHAHAGAAGAGEVVVVVIEWFESLIIIFVSVLWLFLVNLLSMTQVTCQSV
jgi:hypothetical protein